MTEIAEFPAASAEAGTRRTVVILVCAQAYLGAQLPMMFIIGGLAGQSLAANACFATLPLTLFLRGSTVSPAPPSAFLARLRRPAGRLLLGLPRLLEGAALAHVGKELVRLEALGALAGHANNGNRKTTLLNPSTLLISYAVFGFKKKNSFSLSLTQL